MGIRLWFIFQSLGQLKSCFGEKAAEVLDNISTQQYFSINSLETAREISERIGDMTLGIESTQDTGSSSQSTGIDVRQESRSRSWSSSTTRSEIARRLLKPEEVLTLDKNICIIFHQNLPVCLGRLVRYFEAGEFRRRWGAFGPRGTARPRWLGLAAALAAAVTLAASTLVTAMALFLSGVLPPPPFARPAVQAMRARIIPRPRWHRPAYARPGSRPGGGRAAAHRPARRHRRGESGFLLKVQ